jgi:polar amino acid transport system ATP-binding protein
VAEFTTIDSVNPLTARGKAQGHASPAETPVLEALGICKSIGGRPILRDVSLSVNRGEMKVLIGPSGGGKSTFLQCLNYLIVPDSGELKLGGKTVNPGSKKELYALRERVGMIFQDFNLFDHLTALENVSIALVRVKKMSKREAKERAIMELERVGLSRRSGLYPAQLSGGQKQRVAIARALAMDPEVILLDEPTSALDPELVGEVLAVIRELASGGMTMLLATHQMDFARALATEILFMEQGSIIERGAPAKVLTAGTRIQTFFSKLLEEEVPC